MSYDEKIAKEEQDQRTYENDAKARRVMGVDPFGSYYNSQLSFFYKVALGLIPGHSFWSTSGRNENLAINTEKDVAEIEQVHFPDAPVTLYFSSSSAADTQTILLIGMVLDGSDYVLKNEVFILDGQTKTALPTQWLRVFALQNVDNTDLVGDVWIYEDDTVSAGVPDNLSQAHGKITIGKGTSLQYIYTVPSNHVLLVDRSFTTVQKGKAITLRAKFRPFGGVWLTFSENEHDQAFKADSGLPFVLPAKGDIRVTCFAQDQGTTTSSYSVGVLVDLDNL